MQAKADFQIVPSKDLSSGEDARSAPSAIPAGYSESLLNVDTNANGWAATRKGYQGYYGWVPLRVNKITHSGTSIYLRFDTSQNIDFVTVGNSPLLVYGKLPSIDAPVGGYAGDFSTTNALHWYPHFTLSNRTSLSTPSGTATFAATDHGLSTYKMFVGSAVASSPTLSNYTTFIPDSVSIDQTDFEVSVGYTSPVVEDAFFWFLDRSDDDGTTYIDSVSAVTSASITAATHQLDNFNILVQCYDTGTTVGSSVRVIPDSVTIDSAGQVDISFTSAFTGDIILTAAAGPNVATGTATAGTNTISIPNPDSPWAFVSVYFFNASLGKLQEVIPDAITYSEATDTIDITYVLGAGSETVEAYYTFGNTISNRLAIADTGSVSESYECENPQLAVWGLPHDNIYTSNAVRGGHVNHIDTYKRTGEARAICGLGGNVYAARTRAEVGTTYGMPSLYADMRSRVDGTFDLAPLFQASDSTASRTRGVVKDSTISGNKARVTAVSHVSSGVMDVTLTFAGKTGDIALGGAVDTTDYLTVSGLSHAGNNGVFAIQSVQSDSATETVLRVANSSSFSADFDETGADGRAAVYTDTVTMESTPRFIVGDSLGSNSIPVTVDVLVSSVNMLDITLSGITEAFTLSDGVNLYAARTTTLVAMRDATFTNTVTNLVRGDMLAVGDLAREVRVLHVNADSDNTITAITGDGTTATATLSADHHVQIGQKILLLGTGTDHDGFHEVTAVPDTDSLSFASTSVASASAGTLVGKTIELDESLEISDSSSSATTFTVTGRWIPIEIPTTSYDLPATTKIYHLDANEYSNQPKLRSNIISDNMYFTNGDDEVLKFDGTSVYRAGLLPWQPQLFATVDTGTGSIVVDTTSFAWSAKSGNRYTVGLGQPFTTGARVQDSDDGAIYTVIKTTTDGTNDFVYVDRTITGSTAGNLSATAKRKYYLRLNAIDANQNVIASAATGSKDLVVEFSAACQIDLRMVGLPCFDAYDYDRIELQVYSTKTNTPVFYLNRTIPVSFDKGDGYIDFVDGTPDDSLVDDDTVNTALLGAELGTAWDQPLRAKYITTSGNRLVLSHVKGYPEFDVTLRRKASATSLSTSDLSGFRWLFRKDHTDTSTTTDMLNRVRYEFVTSGEVTITPATDLTNNTGTSFTVASLAHGLAVGDWVYLFHSAVAVSKKLTYAGWWQVSTVPDANSFTVKFNHDSAYSPSAADVDRYVSATASVDVPVWLGTDGSYGWFNYNPSTSYEFQAMVRLANAVNATMRMADTDIAAQARFVPWIYASAGSDFNAGQLVVRQAKVESTTAELVLDTIAASDPFQIYVNNILRDSGEQVSSQTLVFPSRILTSYENFPEIFDAPTAAPHESDSAQDVNSADGQDITNAIPFIAVASFNSVTTESKILVLKSNSLYQFDVQSRQYQKIEQPHGGCTASDTVCQLSNGVGFANESGVYRINQALKVEYIGEALHRRWKKEVNQPSLSEAVAHNYINGKQYKLSVPVGTDQTTNNYVFVYDFTKEEKQPIGAWFRHNNFPATGWANLGQDSLFGTTRGQVFKIRNANDTTDYRDDADAIVVEIVTRPEDFDLPGVRKNVSGVNIDFHNDQEAVRNVQVYTAANTDATFTACDTLNLASSTRSVEGVWFSTAKRKCERIQTKITCSTKDSPLTIAGISYRVAPMYAKPSRQAAGIT